MRRLANLSCYTVLVVGLLVGLAGAAAWLVKPDPTVQKVARAAPPIPPRIAESIERKSQPKSEPLRAPMPVAEPVPVRPVRNEAPVAMIPAHAPSKIRTREMSSQITKRKAQRPRNGRTVAVQQAARVEPAVPSGRSDFPF